MQDKKTKTKIFFDFHFCKEREKNQKREKNKLN